MSKYTPGPWKLNRKNGLSVLADVPDWPTGTIEKLVAETVRRSDARLVAAAPEMYEAIRDFLTYYDEYLRDTKIPDECVYLRAAIARAEGRNEI